VGAGAPGLGPAARPSPASRLRRGLAAEVKVVPRGCRWDPGWGLHAEPAPEGRLRPAG